MNTNDKRKRASSRKKSRQRAQQDVTYTPGKAFNRMQLMLRLLTVVAVVLALMFCLSIFFKVDADEEHGKITVSGNVRYDAWDVREASGLNGGEYLLSLNKGRIAKRIMSELPYVDSVRIGISLPDTVHIYITEIDVVYSIEATDGTWWLMSASGQIAAQCQAAEAQDYTEVVGVKIVPPTLGAQAVAAEEETATDPGGQTVPVTVYEREKLEAAYSILGCLEEEGLMGKVTQVDVSSLYDLQMWCGTRFQMLLGDTGKMSVKVNALAQALDQLHEYNRGILDASFTHWPDEVGFSAFSG